MGLRKDVSKIEIFVYVFVWSSAVVYTIYCFARSSNKYFQYYEDLYSDFDQGWSFLSRKKDAGDFEWKAIKWLLTNLSWWIISSTVISEVIRYYQLLYQILPLWQILIAVAFIIKQLAVSTLVLLLFQPLLFFLVLLFTHKKSAIWITSAFALLLITTFKYLCVTEECLNPLKLNVHTSYLTMVSICWMNLRCLSCSMYIIDSKERPNLKCLAYCFYLPNVLCGPFISFEDFQGCYQPSGDLQRRTLELLVSVLRFSFWFAFAELCLHFIYVNAINFHPEWIRSFGLVSLYGYGYTMGQFFHIKYLVLYGLATTFPKFENVKVPSLPVCIGRIHLYSDMWKYFDAGLYSFLLKYIYIPLMKTRLINNRLLASLMCFIFVYVWHGFEYYILLWATLNYFGIVLESFSKWIDEKFLQKTGIHKKVGQKWFRRITCMAASPLLVMSAISNFYFFAGQETGDIFVARTLNAGIQASVILLATMYTCCQVSTEVKFQLYNTIRKERTN